MEITWRKLNAELKTLDEAKVLEMLTHERESGKSCAPARQNQAEAHVDVVGLAAAASMKDQRCQGETMDLGVEDDLG